MKRIEQCRSCHHPVVWLRVQNPKAGKKNVQIVNAETVSENDVYYDSSKHISHFSTCPDARAWRKKKEKP
jgi:hypothetical protein